MIKKKAAKKKVVKKLAKKKMIKKPAKKKTGKKKALRKLGLVNFFLSTHDFCELHHTQMEWGHGWLKHIEDRRFEPYTDDNTINMTLKTIIWLGENYSHVIFSKAYLDSKKIDYEVLWDTDSSEYAIISNFPWSKENGE
jgi:hypothetical protein